MNSLEVRTGTAADLPAVQRADARAFGEQPSPARLAEKGRLIPPDRYVLGLDAGTVVGITAVMPLRTTVPGGAQVAAAGISDVSVAATHRRRGVLREIFTAQHHGLVAEGFTLGLLTASEGTIYGRFGYGPATVFQVVEIDRRRAAVRPAAPNPGGVRQVEADEARILLPAVHARWQNRTPGALHRSDTWWDWQLSDRPDERRGATALQFLVHPDGYATYRAKDATARVVEVVAGTDEAHAALWRVLLGLDFADHVLAAVSPDDPLPFLLTDTRSAHVTGTRDGAWVRLLDVPTALAQRRYAVEVDVVLDVRDGFLDRGGRFRLTGGPDGARCTRTDTTPDVRLDVSTLGSLHLGGHRVRTLHRAGLLEADDPAVLARLDLALVTERAPAHGTDF